MQVISRACLLVSDVIALCDVHCFSCHFFMVGSALKRILFCGAGEGEAGGRDYEPHDEHAGWFSSTSYPMNKEKSFLLITTEWVKRSE
jgi:hypothetical protein